MCCNMSGLSKYCNYKCAAFLIAVLFSAGIFIVSILGLFRVFLFPGSECYSTGLLSSVLTLWCNPPKLEKNKDDEISEKTETKYKDKKKHPTQDSLIV